MEQYQMYFKKFKLALIIFGGALFIFIALLSRIIPMTKELVQVSHDIKTQTALVQDNQRKIADMKAATARKTEESSSNIKAFFKPIDTGLDTESIMSDEFGEILKLIKENQIKTRSIKYDYDSGNDNFVKNGAGKFSSCTLDLEMISNYTSFRNFLRELYRHEHFLDISKIEIVPYQKNKKILLVSLQLKIYAKRVDNDPGIVRPATPEPQKQNSKQINNTVTPDFEGPMIQ